MTKRKRLIPAFALFWAALSFPALVPAQDQEPCAIGPLSATDLAAGPDALNAALACIQTRLEALERAAGANMAGITSPAAIAEMTIFETVRVRLETAGIVDDRQLLLEYSITNEGDTPLFAIIAASQDSRVTISGEPEPRRFEVQGFATCPSFQTRVTQYCIERTPTTEWAYLDPGLTLGFQLATRARGDAITADTAAASIRLIVSDGEEVQFRDVSFGRIPLDT